MAATVFTYEHCTLCPRECGVNRNMGQIGYCGMPGEAVLGLAAPHYWEEPCICGEKGVGAVFFTGCSLGCPYCQNQQLTVEQVGTAVSAARLRKIFDELIAKGVSGIDLINPTHFLPAVLEALSSPLSVPVIYNCGGYEKKDAVCALEGKIDIYLPDLKYGDPKLAQELSYAEDYCERAKAAILEMYRQTGDYQLDGKGMLKKGVIIRHLVLPDQLDNTFEVIDWLTDTFPRGSVLFSLMGQYMPCGELSRFPYLQRPLTGEEYQRAVDYLFALGWEDGYVQDISSSDSHYLPSFDLTGVLPE